MSTNVAPACDWLARKGAVAHERGEDVSAHLAGCVHCRTLFAQLDTIRGSVAQLPAAHPRDHWEQAVWARIDAHRTPRATWMRRWAWLPAVAMAAGVIALFALRPGPITDGDGLALAYHFEKSAAQDRTRGDTAVGDTLVLTAAGIKNAVNELRVYQDRAGLRLRCSNEAPCVRDGSRLQARFRIPAVGTYRVMIVTSNSALPDSSGQYDDDVAALSAQPGVTLRTIDSFEVW